MKTRLLVPLLAAALLALGAPSTASAAPRLPVLGVADNNVSTLQDVRFRRLGVNSVRLTIPWNIFFRPHSRAAKRYSEWLDYAKWRKHRVLVSFTLGDYPNTRRGRKKRFRLAPMKLYLTMFKRFRKRHPWVREFIPWNEANHKFQPTAKNPRAAARYYNAVRKRAPHRRGYLILAGNVLDVRGMQKWLIRYRRYAKYYPRLWGFHSYKGIAARQVRQTRAILRRVRGRVWVTETGGMAAHMGRKPKLRYSEARQQRELRYLFGIVNARRYRRRITRVYVYNWRQVTPNNWDSALITRWGRERPAFRTFAYQIKRRGYGPRG